MTDEIQTIEEYEPEHSFTITDVEALKVISDPLRLQIVETMLDGPYTVKQLADVMKIPATKLYYHFNLLEEHGFLRVVTTRVVKGIIEKLYHLRAYSYHIDRSLLTPGGTGTGNEGFDALLHGMMEAVRADIIKSIQAGLIDLSTLTHEGEPKRRELLLLRTLSRMPKERAKEFFSRFEELVKEFNDSDSKSGDAPVFGLMVAYYPTTHKVPKSKLSKKD